MVQTPPSPQTRYPDSDGKPMADNTVQYQWIVRLVENLRVLLQDKVAFVAGDLLWYPIQVERGKAPSQAPDAMVVLGRPAGDRGSYKQWEEEDIAPQVVFEILSPSNTRQEMVKKQRFYQEHGVLEMYFYDPESQDFWGFWRQQLTDDCVLITGFNLPWISPLLKIRFEVIEDGLTVAYPDGTPFQDFEQLANALSQSQQREQQVQTERDQAQAERDQTQAERDAAFAKLRELGIDPNGL